MNINDILATCDHTLLRVDCTAEEIRKLCDQGIKYNCASVCIPPCHVAGAKKYVGDRLKICTVIGFPNGYMTSAAKAFEAADAVRNGADEIDMVINLSMVKDGCWDGVARDIKAVREACPYPCIVNFLNQNLPLFDPQQFKDAQDRTGTPAQQPHRLRSVDKQQYGSKGHGIFGPNLHREGIAPLPQLSAVKMMQRQLNTVGKGGCQCSTGHTHGPNQHIIQRHIQQ